MNEPVVLPCREVVLRRPRITQLVILLGIAGLVFLLPLLAALLGGIGALVAFGLSIAAFVMSTFAGVRSRKGGSVTFGAGALRIVDGHHEAREVRFTEIVSGYETPKERAAVLLLRDGSQVLVGLDGDGPRQLLEHAGVGPLQRALTMPLRGTLGTFTIGLLSFTGSLMGIAFLVAMIADGVAPWFILVELLLAVVSTVLLVRRFGYPRVVVGTDGIRILGGIRQRFIPYESVAGAGRTAANVNDGAQGVFVNLHDKRYVMLPIIGAPEDRLDGLVRRIHDSARAHGEGAARRVDALARGGRSAASWKEELTRIALAPPGFRDHAFQRDDFERVLVDAAAPPEQRIGAAIALHAMDPTGAPARIRVAADASADDALKEALAAAAEGEVDDAMVDRAAAHKGPTR